MVLFVVDGLRPDALLRTPTPTLDCLAAQGAHTWQAQTVEPSITLACHVSMFYGVPPSRHGVVSNSWTLPLQPVPGLIDLVHEAGLGTAAFYNWEELRDLSRPGRLDLACYRRRGNPEQGSDLEIAAMAASYLASERPAFAFVYLGELDEAGHRFGWMSEPYLQAARCADRAIGLVLKALGLPGETDSIACLVLADHGGHGFDHCSGVAEDLTIPWIAYGAGIRRGTEIAGAVSIVDTAPTVLHLLGLQPPSEWSGRIVAEALAP